MEKLEQIINNIYTTLDDINEAIDNKQYSDVYCDLSYYTRLMEKNGAFIYHNYSDDYRKIREEYISILGKLSNFETKLRGE